MHPVSQENAAKCQRLGGREERTGTVSETETSNKRFTNTHIHMLERKLPEGLTFTMRQEVTVITYLHTI